jgi:hypothetical protein
VSRRLAEKWLPAAFAQRWCAAGCLLAVAGLLGGAEWFVRVFPPSEIQVYLGDDSPLAAQFVADDRFGARYPNDRALIADNPLTLGHTTPAELGDGRAWAFFGSSFAFLFVQSAEPKVAAAHRLVTLDRREPFIVRLAQVRALLEAGFRAERIFLLLLRVDMDELGRQPLDTHQVNSRGARTFEPRWPPGVLGPVCQQSRLALVGWARVGGIAGNPDYDRHRLHRRLDEPLASDLRRLFGNLARLSRDHGVPITVMLLPEWGSVVRGRGFGFQDGLAPMLRDVGIDVFDPRKAFARHAQPAVLYAPDKHLSDAGNRLMWTELLRHLEANPPIARAEGKASRP